MSLSDVNATQATPVSDDLAAHHRSLKTQGYAVMPSLVTQQECATYDSALEREWRRVGEPPLFSQEDVHIDEGMHVSPVGLACAGILRRIPSLADFLLRPTLLAFFERVLGRGFELELGSGVVSDSSRGFLAWHHHAGGIDEPDLRRRRYPQWAQAERIGCTLYTAPIGGEHGTLLVHPRSVDSPTEPPFEPGRSPWPGAQEVHAPAGSVVFIDQGTWHAVTSKRGPGHRHFFAFFVRRMGQATKRRDESIADAFDRHPPLAKAYGGQ